MFSEQTFAQLRTGFRITFGYSTPFDKTNSIIEISSQNLRSQSAAAGVVRTLHLYAYVQVCVGGERLHTCYLLT